MSEQPDILPVVMFPGIHHLGSKRFALKQTWKVEEAIQHIHKKTDELHGNDSDLFGIYIPPNELDRDGYWLKRHALVQDYNFKDPIVFDFKQQFQRLGVIASPGLAVVKVECDMTVGDILELFRTRIGCDKIIPFGSKEFTEQIGSRHTAQLLNTDLNLSNQGLDQLFSVIFATRDGPSGTELALYARIHALDGYLWKRNAGIGTKFQERWFMMDSESNILKYYRKPPDNGSEKCKQIIMSDVTEIGPVDEENLAEIDAKTKKALNDLPSKYIGGGFFIRTSEGLRVFCAYGETDRKRWLTRLDYERRQAILGWGLGSGTSHLLADKPTSTTSTSSGSGLRWSQMLPGQTIDDLKKDIMKKGVPPSPSRTPPDSSPAASVRLPNADFSQNRFSTLTSEADYLEGPLLVKCGIGSGARWLERFFHYSKDKNKLYYSQDRKHCNEPVGCISEEEILSVMPLEFSNLPSQTRSWIGKGFVIETKHNIYQVLASSRKVALVWVDRLRSLRLKPTESSNICQNLKGMLHNPSAPPKFKDLWYYINENKLYFKMEESDMEVQGSFAVENGTSACLGEAYPEKGHSFTLNTGTQTITLVANDINKAQVWVTTLNSITPHSIGGLKIPPARRYFLDAEIKFCDQTPETIEDIDLNFGNMASTIEGYAIQRSPLPECVWTEAYLKLRPMSALLTENEVLKSADNLRYGDKPHYILELYDCHRNKSPLGYWPLDWVRGISQNFIPDTPEQLTESSMMLQTVHPLLKEIPLLFPEPDSLVSWIAAIQSAMIAEPHLVGEPIEEGNEDGPVSFRQVSSTSRTDSDIRAGELSSSRSKLLNMLEQNATPKFGLIKSGYLNLKSSSAKWKTFWFELSENELTFCLRRGDHKTIGKIEKKDITYMNIEGTGKDKTLLITAKERGLFIKGATEVDNESWVVALFAWHGGRKSTDAPKLSKKDDGEKSLPETEKALNEHTDAHSAIEEYRTDSYWREGKIRQSLLCKLRIEYRLNKDIPPTNILCRARLSTRALTMNDPKLDDTDDSDSWSAKSVVPVRVIPLKYISSIYKVESISDAEFRLGLQISQKVQLKEDAVEISTYIFMKSPLERQQLLDLLSQKQLEKLEEDSINMIGEDDWLRLLDQANEESSSEMDEISLENQTPELTETALRQHTGEEVPQHTEHYDYFLSQLPEEEAHAQQKALHTMHNVSRILSTVQKTTPARDVDKISGMGRINTLVAPRNLSPAGAMPTRAATVSQPAVRRRSKPEIDGGKITMGVPSVENKEEELHGYLWKKPTQRALASGKERWFSYEGGRLFYYKKRYQPRPLGSIPLKGAHVAPLAELKWGPKKFKNFGFLVDNVSNGAAHIYELCAKSWEERQWWISMIKAKQAELNEL